MIVLIVPFYAGLLALFYIVLSLRVVRIRRQEKVAVGDGDSMRLRRAIRVHGNFAEYVPLALLLLTFVEMQAASLTTVHVLCIMLLIGRVVHAYGVSHEKEDYRLRAAGMLLTFAAIAASAVILVGSFVVG